MKVSKHIFLLPLIAAMMSCSSEEPAPTSTPETDGIYIAVDLGDPVSRLSYDFSYGEGINSSGSIRAVWELGDIIKVYETDAYGEEGAYSDVYHDYDAYAAQYVYPDAPVTDKYYRFVCVGGVGTTRGIFKYIGLATATVVTDDITGIRNVNVDIKYDHAIRYWDIFQGLVVYGNPLRNHMMRTQVAKNDLSHLKFGERMYGYICAHNFGWWFDNYDQAEDGAGADRLVLKNVGGCVFRVIVGGIDTDVYGGSTITLEIPGVTDQPTPAVRNQPMTLTLGSADDYNLGFDPWSFADPEKANLSSNDHTFCAYIVGWPGTLPANETMVVTLHENVSGNEYTWNLSSPDPITFYECQYYTIDLRDYNYTKAP